MTALLALENIFLHREIRREDEVGLTGLTWGSGHLTRHVPGDRGATTRPQPEALMFRGGVPEEAYEATRELEYEAL